MNRVLLLGVGNLGTHLLELLARDPLPLELVVGDIDERKAELAANNALLGAAHHGIDPVIHTRRVDLLNVAQTTELLSELKPRVVINCAVLQTWHVIRKLPREIYQRLSAATLGAWLPVQLTLALNLARAIRAAGIEAHYVNTSLPDLTHPVLGRLGLAPAVGVGNVDLIEPAVRTLAARKFGVHRADVSLHLVAHHVHWVTPREEGYRPGAPFFLRLTVGGSDVSDEIDGQAMIEDAVRLYPPGIDFTRVSASSALKNLKALFQNSGFRTHAPGPEGLPGGYPVWIDSTGARVALPCELDRDEAIRINEQAQRFDGVERIEEDGTVVFCDYTVSIMKELLGFVCTRFTPQEAQLLAGEQMARFRERLRNLKAV